MIVVLKKNTPKETVKELTDQIESLGYRPHIIEGVERTVIGAVGHEDKEPLEALTTNPHVESVIPILKPYKLVSRELKAETSVIEINSEFGDHPKVTIGGKEIVMMAGPCSVETREQILASAEAVKKGGAKILRGGAFKPRTSPYAFQGHGEAGLELLAEAREATGLQIVTEVVSVTDIPLLMKYTDVFQLGARNCQNFALLAAVGETGKPVLFKRGMSTTIKEYLHAAEYLLDKGNYNVILCERGIRTFETATRNTLDLNAVPVLKSETHLPVFVDPSHGTGVAAYVESMSLAAIAAGADGLVIEVHPEPTKAWSDGAQSLTPEAFESLGPKVSAVAVAVGRSF